MNVLIYSIVVVALSLVSVVIVVGCIALALARNDIPPVLTGALGTALGALVGLLARPPAQERMNNGVRTITAQSFDTSTPGKAQPSAQNVPGNRSDNPTGC